MSILVRYLKPNIIKDLEEKMVFVGGPRQVGKTTFAQSLLKSYRDGHPGYYNWDNPSDRKEILKGEFSVAQKLLIFDEIHKFSKWRNLMKGYYDTQKNTHQFLVTGSARLDYYRKSGDSLLGRYHYHRMHPFTLPELSGGKNLDLLLKFGGFPEPLLKQNESSLKRWHLQRLDRIIQSDVRDLEQVKEISHLALLADAMPERVGSPLSRLNLAQSLEVDFKTVERWISILENVYYCFRIAPFGSSKLRAVKKEQKLYLWDWSEHGDEGKKWENFVASHLLKYCHVMEDTQGDRMELRFLRDVHGREVDFVVLKDKRPLFAVECKSGAKNVSPNIHYFSERTNIPIFYQVHKVDGVHKAVSDKIHLLGFKDFCKEVGLV